MSDEQTGKALAKLIDLHVEDLLGASDEEMLDDARELGTDLEAERRRHADLLERAMMKVGQRRMAGARAALDARRGETARGRAGSGRLGGVDARALTLAARNGTEQSERDRKTVQEDLDDLANFREDPAG